MQLRTFKCVMHEERALCWHGHQLRDSFACPVYNTGYWMGKLCTCPFKELQADGMSSLQYLVGIPPAYSLYRLKDRKPAFMSKRTKSLFMQGPGLSCAKVMSALVTELANTDTVWWIDLGDPKSFSAYLDDRSDNSAGAEWRRRCLHSTFLVFEGLDTKLSAVTTAFVTQILRARVRSNQRVLITSSSEIDDVLMHFGLEDMISSDMFVCVQADDIQVFEADVGAELRAAKLEHDARHKIAETYGLKPAEYRMLEKLVDDYRNNNANIVLEQANLLRAWQFKFITDAEHAAIEDYLRERRKSASRGQDAQ